MYVAGLSRRISDDLEAEGFISSPCFGDGAADQENIPDDTGEKYGSSRITTFLESLGIQKLQARGRTVFIKTLPVEKKTLGGIWFSPKTTSFYDGPAHLRIVRGVVLAAGPLCDVSLGDVVSFQRMNFARWHILGGDTYTGWIDENQILWVEE